MRANIAQVRKQLANKPFQSFWLETIGATRIHVLHPEWFHEVPDGPLIISEPEGVTLTWWTDLSETIEVDRPQTP